MDSECFCIWTTPTFGIDTPLKIIRCISEECFAYVEIQMKAKVIDEKFDLYANIRGLEYNFDQQDIAKAAVDLPLSQGEIKFTTYQCKLGIDFDFVPTVRGYQLSLYWATFSDGNCSKMYHINDKTNILIPFGFSTLKNLKGEYSLFPEPLEGQKISLNITEANIHLLSSTHPKALWLKKEFDEIYNDEKTVNIDFVLRDPRNHLGY